MQGRALVSRHLHRALSQEPGIHYTIGSSSRPLRWGGRVLHPNPTLSPHGVILSKWLFFQGLHRGLRQEEGERADKAWPCGRGVWAGLGLHLGLCPVVPLSVGTRGRVPSACTAPPLMAGGWVRAFCNMLLTVPCYRTRAVLYTPPGAKGCASR